MIFTGSRAWNSLASAERHRMQSHVWGRMPGGSEWGLFLFLLECGAKGKQPLVSHLMHGPGLAHMGGSHWSQLQYQDFSLPFSSGKLRTLPALEWPTYPGLHGIFPLLAHKVPRPMKLLSPGQTRIVGHTIRKATHSKRFLIIFEAQSQGG